MAARVYRGCIVTVHGRDTVVDLIELGMVDFDVIMGMDWLYSCFSKLDYRTRTVRFEFSNEQVVERKGDNVVPKGRFICYLKVTKRINKGCIYHLVRVTDTNAEALTLEFVPVVNEIPGVFPDEVHGILPDREIDFVIDVMLGMQPISIPPYMMAPTELKELKEQLKDLLEKGFTRPRVSPWGTPVLFVRKKDGSLRMCIDYRQLNKELPGVEIEIDYNAGVDCQMELNLRQRRWLELLKDYDIDILYHSGKANMVADALSRKSMGSLAHLEACQRPLAREVHQLASLAVRLADSSEGKVIVQNRVESSLIVEVKEKQYNDPFLVQLKEGIQKYKTIALALVMDDGLPRTPRKFDSIWVIVDRLTKSAHFLPAKSTDTAEQYAHLYIKEIVRLYGTPVSIISDRGAQFMANVWKKFQQGLGIQVNLSISFHPKTDRQEERTIHTLEDMLCACVFDFKGSWDDHLPLIEFAYNINFHASIQMAPFEALYGRRCRSSIG
ncbi:uncharacterized protein [Nicotiana tomentosiformis]|uniref:uncharacterized protein n=1 Tax=Nicotiana tomentosiformis TaxID=4098 RepID=UPI00388CDF4D